MELFLTRLWGCFPSPTLPFSADDTVDAEGRRHLALVVAYQGGAWYGWQYQPGLPTIQGALETVLSKICAHEVRVHASGRTDAGVHAFGQVVNFKTGSKLPPVKMLSALRALLPASIFPLTLGAVAPSFHARYSALAKTYDYYLAPQTPTGAFLRSFLWPLPWALDAKPVAQALMLLVGRQDLRALSTGPVADGWRHIYEASLEAKPGFWRIRLTANGFLRHTVRNLVGILVQIGRGKLLPGQLREIITAGHKLYAAPKAPPAGLYLQKVYYGPWPGPAAD
jgi:tRNA pseudouridine38-40 synthase